MTNISKRILDQCAGSGLTPRGIQQVQHLQQRLRITGEIQATVLLTSTFLRALETAQLLAPVWSIPLVVDDDLQELRYGADDMPYADFNEQYGAFNVRDEPTRQKSPGGESWEQFSARVTTAIDRICQMYGGQRVVVVTHGGVIRALLFSVFHHDLTRSDWGHTILDYTSITQWRHEYMNAGSRWSLIRWNDAAHLSLIRNEVPRAPESR